MKDFDTVLSEEVLLAYGRNDVKEIEPDIRHRALHRNTSTTIEELRGCFMRAAILDADTKEGAYFLRYGASRRLKMLWHAIQRIYDVAPPDRTQPLINEETTELTVDLNVIYMNLRGTLDNYAWLLLHEKNPDIVDKNSPHNIGLFGDIILKQDNFAEISPLLAAHISWAHELKQRRDPVAHRIPLSVVPSVLTDEQAKEYVSLFGEYGSQVAAMEFEKADEIFAQIDQMGIFAPIFGHHPDEGYMPIYPVVVEDIRHLVEIGTTILDFLFVPEREA